MQQQTRLVHSGRTIDPHTGALSVPIYQVSTFHQSSLAGNKYEYSRSANPTREALEEAIAELEGGIAGFAFASGMAAISTVLSMFSQGDHLIAPKDLYGGTYRLLTQILPRWGITTSLVDMTDLNQVESAFQANTKAIWLETPSNPLLRITDLKEIGVLARRRRALTIIDNTFMSPYLQRPLELGIDIVVHSATKFLAGHSDVVAGLAVVREQHLAREIKFLQNGFGSILGPQDSWLVLRGIKTLGVRLERQQQTAYQVAAWLQRALGVKAVYYPGLPGHPGQEIHQKQSAGPGTVVSFQVADEPAARRLLSRVRLMAVAVSLGGVESILSYPKTMSHGGMSEAEQASMGVGGDLLRLSIGLEDPADLIQDLQQALQE